MSYLEMLMTTNVPKLVRRAKVKARLGSASTSLDFISSDPHTCILEATDLVNDAIREVLDDFPILNVVAEATLNVPLGGTSSPLPVDLRHNDIVSIHCVDQEIYRPLVVITKPETAKMDSVYRLPKSGQRFPFWYYIENNEVHFLPHPSEGLTVKMKYRSKQSVAVPADITKAETDPTATIVPIPNDMIELAAIMLAKKFSDLNSGVDGSTSQSLLATYELMKNKFVNNLSQSFDQLSNNTYDFEGVPMSKYGRDYDGLSSGLEPLNEDYF